VKRRKLDVLVVDDDDDKMFQQRYERTLYTVDLMLPPLQKIANPYQIV
jgi:hypothetical protein